MDKLTDEIVLEAYTNWRSHPVTGLFIKNLKRHRERAAKHLSEKASDITITDAMFRQQAHILKTCDAIIEMTLNFDKFREQVNNQPDNPNVRTK